MKNISINTEDFIFIILIISIVINIIGNNYTKNNKHDIANKYYMTSLIVTIIIYFYFLYKYYDIYKTANNNDKKIYKIKLIGICLLISGVLCLIYFQINDPHSSIAPV